MEEVQPPTTCLGIHGHFDGEWTTRLEEASTVSPTPGVWLPSPCALKLNPDRWRAWDETPPGAVGHVDWVWAAAPPARSEHANHGSARKHARLLGEQLDTCARLNMIEWCPPGMLESAFVHNVLPLGAELKSNGSVRMLVDPSLPGVNAAMADLPCKLTSVEQIFGALEPGMVLGKRDLTNGFFHVVCSQQARRHMGLKHPVTGRLGRWIVLPQGTKQSPALFCDVTDASARIFTKIFAQQGIKVKVFVYCDDYILLGSSHADMVRAFAAMDEEASALGLVFNPAKDKGRDTPCTCLEALGLEFDAVEMVLRLPAAKRESYSKAIVEFETQYRGSSSCPRKPLERLVGKLVYACRVSRWGFLFIQSICDQLFPVGVDVASTRAPVLLSEALWHDLEFWKRALGPEAHAWVGVQQHMLGRTELLVDPSKFRVELFTDASKSFGAGGILGLQAMSHKWSRDVSAEHIGALELEALLVALRHWKSQLAGQRVIARLDNIQAVCALNKGASRLPALRDTLLHIALLGMEAGFEVRAKYIKGELNPADAPSRGKPSAQFYAFAHFQQFNTPPAVVDCCAATSGCNAMPGCTQWFSPERPVQDNVHELVGKVLWANIPFASVGVVLDALAAAWLLAPATTIATCVVPDWPTMSWYRKYLRRKKPLFRVIHSYPAGSKLFFKQGSRTLAGPCPFAILVVRMGGPLP